MLDHHNWICIIHLILKTNTSARRSFADHTNADREFEIYKTAIDDRDFKQYHERLQPFLLFYVDAASYIEVDDARWDFYVV